MSGFVVLFNRQGTGLDRGVARAMLDRIDHRGPDGSGLWCDGNVALGHQHLQSTPESKFDDQPARDDGLVVVADARLDNRGELRQKLGLREAGRPVPDSQLLLAAYKKWGRNCVERLLGSFAFVIWDDDRDVVFCARDRFGVKPLYVHRGDDVFAAASELKALLTHPAVSAAVDEVKIGDFLVGRFDDKERTFYREIRRLPPAHTLTIGTTDVEKRQYWDLDPTRTISLESDSAYERRFRELFQQAVECRLRTSGTVGTSLSGGLDSSSITVMARTLVPSAKSLPTFSNVYDDAPSSDEREFIESVTARRGIESNYVFLDDVGSFGDCERMFRHYDLPPHDTMHHAIWERVKRADRDGVDVLLEGALGDSAVGYGLGFLSELLRTGRWWQLWSELRAMSDIVGASPRHLFVRHAVAPLVPEQLDRLRSRLRGDPILEAAENPALDSAFVDRIGLRRRIKATDLGVSVLRETARRRQRRSLLSGLLTASLETADLAFAAFGVEPRYPFTDTRLVEFSLAMPPSQQLSDGWTRSIIRRSLRDLLPEQIRTRPWKTDMSEGFCNSLALEQEDLQRLVNDPGPLTTYLDEQELRTTYDRFPGNADIRDARVLFRALSLSKWFDADTVADRNPRHSDGELHTSGVRSSTVDD
ncbi:asparagine synthase (glutamine-hydrolyzing) [Halopiger xanaduensis]|uniref:Putative asparagine synthetase [glutamine-hydrolyzing] n=1 Tax=Halopiger xanaduensis (strain DSM 18323 / JCM 14033 / SH-6) TaxID=797210 RepID=F8DD45_HALXS|nr:asparagine synthase (glutamine-hydrolyzing) [Halopiger xanaduensis]AEH38932.1 asparagine synthase [Halopiger xanaduensis SH-6]